MIWREIFYNGWADEVIEGGIWSVSWRYFSIWPYHFQSFEMVLRLPWNKYRFLFEEAC
jgi:hypothetical protein